MQNNIQEHKDKIEVEIVKLICLNLENGTLTQSDLSPISTYVLEKIDAIQTEEELLLFLSVLSQKWPVFANLQTLEKGKAEEQANTQAVQVAQDLAKVGNIDAAVDLIKPSTEEQQSN